VAGDSRGGREDWPLPKKISDTIGYDFSFE
jgi:hypothetical protein